MDINFDFEPDFSDSFDDDWDSINIDQSIDFDDDRFENRYISPKKIISIPDRFMKYSRAEKLASDIEIKTGSRYYVILGGGFIFGDFLEALIVEKNYLVKSMTISTLSMSQNNIDSLANLINGNYLKELNIIISDYFFSHERNNLIKYMYEILDINNIFQLSVAGTHCKTCIIETDCGKFITIHGSSNLRSSANIEQIAIEESKQLYDFNYFYQKNIIDQYHTIKKPIRVKRLWQTVAKEKAEVKG